MTLTMTPSLRKFALTAHILSSVGLLGSIAAFLSLAVAGLTSQDAQIVLASYLAMDVTARFVIVPLAFASLLTGVIQSLGTPWGLFRHYWVLAKLLLTVFATIVLLVKMELISYAARLAAETILSRADLRAAGIKLAVPRRWWPAGVARACGALGVQTAGLDSLRAAYAARATYAVATILPPITAPLPR